MTEDHLGTVVWIVATAGEITQFPEDVAATCLDRTEEFKERCDG